jgi:hypothetical protein
MPGSARACTGSGYAVGPLPKDEFF